MNLQKECDSFAQNIDLVDKCVAWLNQYKDSYRIMNRICCSKKGNRYSFQLVTDVHLENDELGKENYRFSLELRRSSGEVFLIGPSIFIDSNNHQLVSYMLLTLSKYYLETNSISNIDDTFLGYWKQEKPAPMKSYSPACVVFDARDAMKDDYLRNLLQREIICYSDGISDDLLLRTHYNAAKMENSDVNDQFLDSIEKSNNHYARVLRFDSYKKKR